MITESLAEIAACIDWGPFFQTWDLAGPYPKILTDEVVGEAATKVFADGQAMLKRVVEGRWLSANGVMGFWPANTVDDDTNRKASIEFGAVELMVGAIRMATSERPGLYQRG